MKGIKHFKKKGFWVFYVAIVLAGAFIIVALGLQSQSPRIPNVNAQGFSMGIGTTPTGYSFAGDIMFAGASFPGDIMRDGSGMRTIMTCSGCTQTMSTCDWQCGPTFSQCGTRAGQGSTLGICMSTVISTMSTCGNSLFDSCGGGTMSTCSSSIFGGCGGTTLTCGSSFGCGGGTTLTCSGSLFGCGGGGGYTTYSTCGGSLCNIVSYTLGTCNIGCGYVIPTSETCGCRTPAFTSNDCPNVPSPTMGIFACTPQPSPTIGFAPCEPSQTRLVVLCNIEFPIQTFSLTQSPAY